jgi:N-acetylglutamate synthase
VSEAAALARIIDCIALPSQFVLAMDGGTPAACALAVLEGPWVGLYDITTNPNLLRRGHGMRVVTALLGWARDNGASAAYLQVRGNNPPALALYARLGFRSVYEYRYWRR